MNKEIKEWSTKEGRIFSKLWELLSLEDESMNESLCFSSPKCCIYALNSSPHMNRAVAWLCVLDSSFSSLFRGSWLLSGTNLSTPLIVPFWTCWHVGERNLTGHNLSTCCFLAYTTCRHVCLERVQSLANGRPTVTSNGYFFESKFESYLDTSAPNLSTCWPTPCWTCRDVKPVENLDFDVIQTKYDLYLKY